MKADDAGATEKKRKRGLGKGLDALFPDIEIGDQNQQPDYFPCDINRICPNPFQPRRQFPREEMAELAESVKIHGVLQPLLVREAKNGYELIAGERRLRAAKMAGLFTVPVLVRGIGDQQLLALSIIENIQRTDLNAMDEAEAYQRLLDEFGLTQEQVAGQVGKSRSAVANFLRLNQLADTVKEHVRTGDLSMGHARALLGANNASLQQTACRTVVSRKLSVRETEKLVGRLNTQTSDQPQPAASSEEIHFSGLEEDLGRKFGTRVKIKRQGRKGRVEIEFYDDNDLDRLLALLKTD